MYQDTDYVINVESIGEANASIGYLNFFFYDKPFYGRP